ncbi:hypothetical protein AB0J21_08120 [Streptomyces sp. NPDC049954]|uniref:hypothetical protein n=1 Tax=Streptomyces sp. NPDC049954 TaxID=3155779 RepID=UPI0034307530
MAGSGPHVTVDPPAPDGGRRVRADGENLGVAHGTRDLAEFLRRAGLEDADESVAESSGLIEWRGGGPETWEG